MTAPDIRLHFRTVKRAMRKYKLPDTYFVSRYAFSPYMACSHGCLYCDGRAEKYYVEGVFDRDIIIRKNIVSLLELELPKLREKGTVVIGSGISDPYQPVESDEKLMRGCAELLAKRKLSAAVLTKSPLVCRDLDIWKTVNESAGFTLMMSLVMTEESIRQALEPRAGTVTERLETLALFQEHGCTTGVLAMPLLPFLTDSEPTIRALAARLSDTGVDFVIPGILTLRPGRQKTLFMNTIRDRYPDLLEQYRHLYRDNRASGAPLKGYIQTVMSRATRIFSETGIACMVPHQLYHSRFQLYDEMYILMSHLFKVYADDKRHLVRLDRAFANYKTWLDDEKTRFNRRRNTSAAELELKLRHMMESGRMAELLDNPRLAEFMDRAVFQGEIFDYLKRQFI